MIPLTFVLAFYMNHVVQRWWETWKMIPWPFSIAIKINTFLLESLVALAQNFKFELDINMNALNNAPTIE